MFFNYIQDQLKNLKIRFSAFLQSPEWIFTISLTLALVFVGIRFLSLVFNNPELKILIWSVGILFVFVIWSLKDTILAKWLNNSFIQLIMFLCLRLEDIIWSCKGPKGYLAIFSIVFGIVHSPAILFYICLGFNPFIWYWFIMIFSGIYFRFRSLFIFPSMSRIEVLKEPDYMPLIEHPDKFTWDLVVKNANTVFFRLHGRPVLNKLGSKVGAYPLRYAGIRYMTSWKLTAETLKKISVVFSEYAAENPKQAAASFSVIAASGIAAGGSLLYLQHMEAKRAYKDAETAYERAKEEAIQGCYDRRSRTIEQGSQIILDHGPESNIAQTLTPIVVQLFETQAAEDFSNNSLNNSTNISNFIKKGVLFSKIPITNDESAQIETPLHNDNLDKIRANSLYEEPGIFFIIIKKIKVIISALFF